LRNPNGNCGQRNGGVGQSCASDLIAPAANSVRSHLDGSSYNVADRQRYIPDDSRQDFENGIDSQAQNRAAYAEGHAA
jgi:hypothetical protein